MTFLLMFVSLLFAVQIITNIILIVAINRVSKMPTKISLGDMIDGLYDEEE